MRATEQARLAMVLALDALKQVPADTGTDAARAVRGYAIRDLENAIDRLASERLVKNA